jgi:hypothetical protein
MFILTLPNVRFICFPEGNSNVLPVRDNHSKEYILMYSHCLFILINFIQYVLGSIDWKANPQLTVLLVRSKHDSTA